MRLDLHGRVNNVSLPQSRPLLPVLEAVVNSLHAIEDLGYPEDGRVTITVRREPALALDEETARLTPIESFCIEDTGVGFDERNYESFSTSDSVYKAPRGGKGVGRFLWLKAFGRVLVESTFECGGRKTRRFSFSVAQDISDEHVRETPAAPVMTRVQLLDFLQPYRQAAPRHLAVVGQKIVEHCLAFFMNSKCPAITLADANETIDLRAFFRENFSETGSDHSFTIQAQTLRMRGLRFSGGSERNHCLVYAAHSREVKTERLERFLPNLRGKREITAEVPFRFVGFVEGEYLDRHVNAERTGFTFPDADEELDDSPRLTESPRLLSLEQIRGRALELVREDLRDSLARINEEKVEQIRRHVETVSPQYRPLLRYLGEFIDQIAPGLSPQELELALYRQLHDRQVELKTESGRLLKDMPADATPEDYVERLGDFMERFNDLGKSTLAQYVIQRRVVLDFLEKALEADRETGKYALEKAVHRIIFPMQRTSDEVSYDDQNLWIIDERLSYHVFLASDKQLRAAEPLDSQSSLRPDILVFDSALAFGEGSMPVTSIVIIEFKRPQREDYDEGNPVKQVYAQLRAIRAGHYKDARGREIRLLNPTVPAFAYIVCDLTEELEHLAQESGLARTPDRLGYFGYNQNYDVYVEVISYDKLVADAKKRNRVLFEKLNLQ